MIKREIQPDGVLTLSAGPCVYCIKRLQPGKLFLTITGKENGALGRAALGEVAAEAALHPPLRLFIDMSHLTNVSESVGNDWSAWLKANRASLSRVDVLAPQTFVRLVVTVSQVLSGMENVVYVHTEAQPFAKQLATVISV